MSELKENTKTEGTIFARFAKLENMIAMFSPDLPDVKISFHVGPDFQIKKKGIFVSDQICGMKKT